MNQADRSSKSTEDYFVIDEICDDFDTACASGDPPEIELFLDRAPPAAKEKLLLQLIQIEVEYRQKNEVDIDVDQYARFGEEFKREAQKMIDGLGFVDDEFVRRFGGQEKLAGRYKILENIGSGGMGTVYLADQRTPVKRRVAVKFINRNKIHQTKQVIARFEAERQALAMMNHPNITKVLDVGTTNDGWPFFAMEFVQGESLTQFCDRYRTSIDGRLRFFLRVCDAIQHAHRKGIIHRDIKPSNVLVTKAEADAVPKVIDFGLAKALNHQPLTEKSIHTAIGAAVGTAEYMSPEQAENREDVDTRTDIYSLGVLLYELLAGSTPIKQEDAKNSSQKELLDRIQNVDPESPSKRISGSSHDQLAAIAGNRSIEPTRICNQLRKELDWIVLKAIEKDPARRYQTVNDFVEDVRRYLNNELVSAKPQSIAYKLRKFAGKNQILVGSSLSLFVITVVAFCSILVLYNKAVREQQEKERVIQELQAANSEKEREAELARIARKSEEEQKAVAMSVRDFLQDNFLRKLNAWERANQSRKGFEANVSILDLLNQAAAKYAPDKIESEFPNQPSAQAEILQIIGNAFSANSEHTKAVQFMMAAYEIEKRIDPNSDETTRSRVALFFTCLTSQEMGKAISLLEEITGIIANRFEEARLITNDAEAQEIAITRAEHTFHVTVSAIKDRMDLTKYVLPVVAPSSVDSSFQLLWDLRQIQVNLWKLIWGMRATATSTENINSARLFFEIYHLGIKSVSKYSARAIYYRLSFGLPWKLRESKLSDVLAFFWPTEDHERFVSQYLSQRQADGDKKFNLMVKTMLAVMFQMQNKNHQQVLQMFQELYVEMKRQSIAGPKHPTTLILGNNLADELFYRNQFKQAALIYSEILPDAIEIAMVDDESKFAIMYDAAVCYFRAKDLQRLEQARESALEISRPLKQKLAKQNRYGDIAEVDNLIRRLNQLGN